MDLGRNSKTPDRSPRSGDLTNNDSHRTPVYLQQKRSKLNSILNYVSPNAPPTKVINPFEAALADRLHLPLIESPSLFQRPATPQFSSTQFEWTIEDVSSLNPANVETSLNPAQFTSVVDPQVEEKAQAAIETFFKENLYVPSPLDCVLRKHKIVLKDYNQSPTSFIRHSYKRTIKRDGECQTELTLPPILPENIENLLKPYFSYLEDQQQTPIDDDCDKSITDYDVSLRRKLFDVSLNKSTDNDSCQNDLVGLSPPPVSPVVNDNETKINFCGTPSTDGENVSISTTKNLNDSSFGSLSPISKFSLLTTTENPIRNRRRSYNFMDSVSPLHRSRSTPPDLRTSIRSDCAQSTSNMSVEFVPMHRHKNKIFYSSGSKRCYPGNDCDNKNDNQETNQYDSDEEMVLAENSFHVTTPVRKKRKCDSRKNLTHSFRNESELMNSNRCKEDTSSVNIRFDFKQIKGDSGFSDTMPPSSSSTT